MHNNHAHKQAVQAVVEEILEKININSKQGKFYLHFKLDGDRHYAQKYIEEEVRRHGYYVTNPSDEYTTLVIDWTKLRTSP